MDLSFESKVALVTGAASGMGLATAEAFAEAGAAVALVDLNEAAVCKVAERLVAEGYKAIPITCDVTVEAQVRNIGTWSNKPFPLSAALMLHSTMPACRVLLLRPPMPPVKNSTA